MLLMNYYDKVKYIENLGIRVNLLKTKNLFVIRRESLKLPKI